MFKISFLIKKKFKIYNKYDRFWTEFDLSKKIIIVNNSTKPFLKKAI
jgi:hypothetical protein